MSKQNVIDDFLLLKKGIKKNESLQLIEFDIRPALNLAEIRQLFEDRKIASYPSQLVQFYSQSNGITLQWKWNNDLEEIPVRGTIDILPLETVLFGYETDCWENEFFNKNNNGQLILPFDYCEPEDSSGICFALNDDNCIEEGLILTSLTFGNRYINQSLDVYLKWLLYSKGYFRSSYIFGENKNLTAYDNFKDKFESDILRLFT
jgi:hypothetical protein